MAICVVVVDMARARFLAVQQAETPELEGGPNLVELKDLINPEGEERGRDLWSDTKTGLGRDPHGAQAHSYDDHREEHEAEFERRFAKRVAEEAQSCVQTLKARTLVVAAQKRMLGFLRPALTQYIKGDVEVREMAKDLTKLSIVDLHRHLADEKLLPPRLPPGAP